MISVSLVKSGDVRIDLMVTERAIMWVFSGGSEWAVVEGPVSCLVRAGSHLSHWSSVWQQVHCPPRLVNGV